MKRTRILIAGAFAFVLIIGTTVFAASSDPGSDTDPITTKSYVDTQLNNKAANLQNQLNKANKTIAELQKKLTALETKVANQSSKPTTPTTPTAPSYKTGIVTTASLNVRSGPSASQTKVGALKKDAKVTILGSKSVSGTTWYQVQAGTLKGWVHGAYIKVNK